MEIKKIIIRISAPVIEYSYRFAQGTLEAAIPRIITPAAKTSVAMKTLPHHKHANGIVANDDNSDWSQAWSLFSGDIAYIWHAQTQSPVVANSLLISGFKLCNLIVWAKNALVIGRGNYHHQHEPCWYVVRENATRHWIGDRKQTTLWQIDKQNKSETGHSTQKPIECMARPIRNHDSEYVYDPFCGSGTTLIACEQLKRSCLAMEIMPNYGAIIIDRFVKHTGIEPLLL
jgi:hypothetical protein